MGESSRCGLWSLSSELSAFCQGDNDVDRGLAKSSQTYVDIASARTGTVVNIQSKPLTFGGCACVVTKLHKMA